MRYLFAYCLTVILILLVSHDGHCIEFGFTDVISEVANISTGLTKHAIKTLPDRLQPDKFFEMSKNTLIGLPFEVLYTLIDKFCTMALHANSIKVTERFTPKVELISFVLKTKTNDIRVPLTNANAIWTHSEFNPNNPLVIFVSGWKTDLGEGSSEAQDEIAAAYLCRGNINFVTVDTANFVDTFYEWSAFNTEAIGQYISKALQVLIETYPLKNIHLIGHSLGAQICGACGRDFNQTTGLWIPRITGLDPANTCFNNGEVLSGLFRGDAQFVDVIHTNAGVLGKREAIGDADYFCNGIAPLQPGCFSASCAHARAHNYYAESVYPGNENNFLARECNSLRSLDLKYCLGPLIPMGYAALTYVKGNYFLHTNSKSPYGENSRKFYQPVCVV